MYTGITGRKHTESSRVKRFVLQASEHLCSGNGIGHCGLGSEGWPGEISGRTDKGGEIS